MLPAPTRVSDCQQEVDAAWVRRRPTTRRAILSKIAACRLTEELRNRRKPTISDISRMPLVDNDGRPGSAKADLAITAARGACFVARGRLYL